MYISHSYSTARGGREGGRDGGRRRWGGGGGRQVALANLPKCNSS